MYPLKVGLNSPWDLLRIGRLSVVPVPDAMWTRIEELSKNPE